MKLNKRFESDTGTLIVEVYQHDLDQDKHERQQLKQQLGEIQAKAVDDFVDFYREADGIASSRVLKASKDYADNLRNKAKDEG